MIEKYIVKLLEKNNRVIVPDFGAFLRGSGSSKNIFFNEFIKVDDGLLINFIIENEKISRNEAAQEIAEFIESVKKELSKKQKSIVEGMGVLYKDEKGRIKLEVDEKMKIPIVTDKQSKTPTKEKVSPVSKIDKNPITMKTQTSQKKKEAIPEKKDVAPEKKKNKTLILILLILIPVIIIVVLGYLYQDKIFSSLTNKKVVKKEIVKENIIDKTIKTTSEKKTKITDGKETNAGVKNEANKTTIAKDKKPVEKKAKKEIEQSDPKYYLIGGVFKEIQNAKDLLSELEYEGFTEANFTEINGLNYLCYNSYKSYSKAKSELQNIKDKGYEVWILKH